LSYAKGKIELNDNMITALPIRAVMASPFLHASRHRRRFSGAGVFQVFRNPSEWKCAVTVALVFFIASLVFAPVLTTDQRTLAAEINSKTLKAAAAIKTSAIVSLNQ
jgi:hypothetical protein